ncbi:MULTISPECIES: Pr6Pr family membrane protein [unclassified Leucobacter]|uniref:Pr6Pr family membrane protein n=1 Tax=unclassified Leucobacter TaxID=2621730 RepID=UPI00165D6A93|nr:Pr6Pr family membrane protein [Leucobacter sp. CX169]MBC9926780.1 Pr6Pr family membrane protein [Leucobacter sp. cx-169]MBC9935258.1 Pr6Pr family membrane protein [Leucobacter sp. cx-87]
MTRVWPWVRLAGAALILAAVIAQLSVTITGAIDHHRDVATTAVNFMSFFTIQSNLLAMVTLAVGAFLSWRRPATESREPIWFAALLASVTTYMIVTGIVYNTLLRGVALPQGTTVPWSNEVLHVIAPLILLLDLLVAPGRRGLGWGRILTIAAYPIAWVAYTLIRGPITVNPVTGEPWWYPYPFLNPHLVPGGFLGVTGYIIGIAIAIVAVGAAVLWWGRRRDRA